MSNFWNWLRWMKLYNQDKNKGKFQIFVNFTKKVNGNDFTSSIFIKTPYNIFLLTLFMFKSVKAERHIVHASKNK